MLNVAIIGAGQIAEKVHVAYYLSRQNDVRVVAVVDPNIERAKEFAVRNNIRSYYKNATELFEKEKIDIVSVCTPNAFHYENVMISLKNKANVFCEKPPALNANQAREMMQLAEENNCLLAYDFQHRFSEEAFHLKKSLQKLGDIYLIDAKALRRCGIPGWGNFINKDIQGGGPLIDLGIHMLDSLMYIMDFPKVKSVNAYSFQKIGNKKSEGAFGSWNPNDYTVEDSLFATIECESGLLIRLDTSFALNMKEKNEMNLYFYGDNAGASLYPLELYTDNKGELEYLYRQELSKKDKHQESMSAFVNSVLNEKDSRIADANQGYLIQKIVEAIYQSAELREVVML